MNILVTSDCTKKALKQTRTILDSFGYRISKKTWLIEITNQGLTHLINLLKKKARKNNSISIYNGKTFKQIAFIGNKNMYNIATNQCAVEIKNKVIATNKLETIIGAAGFLHDLGKANSLFQKKLRELKPDLSKDVLRHDILSVIFIDYLIDDSQEFKSFLEKYKTKNIIDTDINALNLVKLLILTHHKTPLFDPELNSSENRISSFNIFNKVYFNKEKKEILSEVDCLLTDYLKNKSKKLISELKNISLTKEEFEYFLYVGRYCLISGDHFASSYDKYFQIKNNKDEFDKILIAKSISTEGDGFASKKIYKTQTLISHLKNVQKSSLKFLHTFYKIKFKGVENLSLLEDTDNDNFLWQNKSIKYIKENYNIKNNGLFFVTSSTGSGKTKFSARLALQVSKNKRITTLLGLRSLTLQTGKEYKKTTGLEDSTILIGSKGVRDIYNAEQEEEREETEEFEELITQSDLEYKYKFEVHEDFFINKTDDFHLSPVLVCTIDYLIQAVNHSNTKFLNAFLRLKTSDLVIDEVDNYSLNDIKSIGKLLYYAGMFGKNVVISTATPSLHILSFLENMYKKGSNLNSKNVDVFLLSNTNNEKKEFVNLKLNNLNEDLSKYSKLLQNNKKHKIEIVDIKDFEAEIKKLHKNNNVNGYSAGLIRVANIKYGMKLFKKLKDKFEVIFYHSQIPTIQKSFIESMLDETLSRKDNDELEGKSLFKLTKDKMIVVIATPLEEVGRDHDFDWAIIEPSSTRSIIQTTGRVYRHRNNFVAKHTNIIIMNKNFKLSELKEEDSDKVYIRPGFEENSFGLNKDKEMNKIGKYFNNGLNQKFAINPSEEEIFSYKESMEIKNDLNKYLENYSSVLKFPHAILFKNKYNELLKFSHYINFRESTPSVEFFITDSIKYRNKYRKIVRLANVNILDIEYEKFELSNIYFKLNESFEDYVKSLNLDLSMLHYNVLLNINLEESNLILHENRLFGVFNKNQFGKS